jgi:starvation-inducible outer membrane lipoprotein
MRNVMIVMVALAGLAGCAKTPDQIQASYASDVSYRPLSCADLASEEARASAALVRISEKQQQTAEVDAAGVFLFGMPAGSMAGGNVAPEVGRLKGEVEAIRRVRQAKKCPGAAVVASAQ